VRCRGACCRYCAPAIRVTWGGCMPSPILSSTCRTPASVVLGGLLVSCVDIALSFCIVTVRYRRPALLLPSGAVIADEKEKKNRG